jgi:uncharacterized protein
MRFLPWILRALLLLMVLRFVLRLLFPPRRPVGPAPRGARPQERLGGELVRDPQCGTYVPKGKALAIGSGDATLYFCSAACYDAYAAAHAAPSR